jgi:hypothetical protein
MAALAAVVLLPCVSFMRLNPDSYLHFSLSTTYLQNPIDIFQIDAGTVGQAVPGLIAALRTLFGARDLDDPQLISESLQILFYAGVIIFLTLSWASMKQSKAHRFSLGVCLGAASLLGILTSSDWSHMDFHSYNGEIFAVVLLTASCLAAFRPISVAGILIRAVLAASMAYVKAQALPAVLLLLLIRNRNLTLMRLRINERLLLVTVAAGVFLLFEMGIILFAGHPFLSKIPYLFQYMHAVEAPASAASPDFAAFLSQETPKSVPLQTLPWALGRLIVLAPGIFVSLGAFFVLAVISSRFRFRGRRYFEIAACYLLVAMLSIALPGNKFEHYLLLTFPVMSLLSRGFSVAGARLHLRAPVVLAGFLSVLGLAEMALVINDNRIARYVLNHKSVEKNQADMKQWVPYDLVLFLRQNVRAGHEFFVHGFDFELYAYTNSRMPRINLGVMMSKTRRLEDFCDYARDLNKLAPMFIVDAVAGKWGAVTKEGLALATNPTFKALILDNYRLNGRYSGIPVYERVGNAPANTIGTACAK